MSACLHASRLLMVLVAALLTGCGSLLPVTSANNALVQSENDQREYRYLRLQNGLRVLLVSDLTTEKSSASLDLNIGSRQDPRDYQGLAHFLEHMLFLGTAKYPEAGDYQAFISAHGGSHNAYTAFEHTNYFFDIDPDAFPQALDRFSQFFIAPLFTERYVAREKNAVHSEYMAKLKDESRRGWDVLKTLVNQEHPFSKLSVGNLETLSSGDSATADQRLREQLLTFYERYYSANLMTLVMVDNRPLDEMAAMAKQRFAAIINRNVELAPIELPLFTAGTLPLSVNVQSEQALRRLSISFPTPSGEPFYRQKPLYFIGSIIGHEGQGSLLSYLKAQGWVETLSAGPGFAYQGGATFNVSMGLTEAGRQHTDEIIASVFQAINRIKSAGDMQRVYDQQAAIARQSFRFLQKAKAIRYASGLAADMHYFDREDILRGNFLMADFDAALIQRFLNYLRPDNSLITLTAPDLEVDKTSYFYQTGYRAQPTSMADVARWEQLGVNPAIKLPVDNPFIVDDYSVLANVNQQPADAVPELIIDQPGIKLWYKQSTDFSSPKGSINIQIGSPVAGNSIEHFAQQKLLAALLADQLNEMAYVAQEAGLSYAVSAQQHGLTVKVSGFSQRQQLLLDKILTAVTAPVFDQKRFSNIKSEFVRGLQNANKRKPYNVLVEELRVLVYEKGWNSQQLLSAIEPVSLSGLKNYYQQLMAENYLEVLVYGNYRKAFAERIGATLQQAVLQKTSARLAERVVALPDETLLREMQSSYSDAGLIIYLQGQDAKPLRRAAFAVSAQVLRADYYSKLRTEQQLGYIVSSGAYPVRELPGMYFLVQSPVAGPEQLVAATDQFLQQRMVDLPSLDEQEFIRQREAVLLRLEEKPQNLWQQSQRYWQDIREGNSGFDQRQRLIEVIRQLTFEQWRAFFVEDVIENPRRLILFARGQFATDDPLAGKAISDTESFKKQAEYYEFP